MKNDLLIESGPWHRASAKGALRLTALFLLVTGCGVMQPGDPEAAMAGAPAPRVDPTETGPESLFDPAAYVEDETRNQAYSEAVTSELAALGVEVASGDGLNTEGLEALRVEAPMGPPLALMRGPTPSEASVTGAGPYSVQSYSSGYADGAHFLAGTIWYPDAATTQPLGLVAVCPGFLSPQSSIAPWGAFLASHGFAVITLDTNTGFDFPDVRRNALLDALNSLVRENTRFGSPLAGRLDTSRQAVIGWSMGGGGATQAANENPNLRAAIGLTTWYPGYTPSRNQVPSLWLASLGDPLAGGQSQSFYTSTPSTTPKMLIEWPSADHFFANDPTANGGLVARYGLSWMKVYLDGDDRYRKFLTEPAGSNDFRSNVSTDGDDDLPTFPSTFVNLAPDPGLPFDPITARVLNPPAPTGWDYFPVSGTQCRDGSELGVYVHVNEQSSKLVIYFEGGGACVTGGFCNFNPPNVNFVLSGDGQTVLGTAAGAVAGRQQPGVYTHGVAEGIFDFSNLKNPVGSWNMIYIPYCSGDVHAGTRNNVTVPDSIGLRSDMPRVQQFMGHSNTEKIVARAMATFGGKIDQLLVTGASAGSFGALLNFSMIADAFPGVQADALGDSGAPFDDAYWPTCLQDTWRTLFGLDDALPPDCPTCFNGDGGGLLGMADFLLAKHPTARVGLVSSLQDEVIRLFFAPGNNNCALKDTADPVEITLGQVVGAGIFPAQDYQDGLLDVRGQYAGTQRLATYFMAGNNLTSHQHIFRSRFYETPAGGVTLAQFMSDLLVGNIRQVGP